MASTWNRFPSFHFPCILLVTLSNNRLGPLKGTYPTQPHQRDKIIVYVLWCVQWSDIWGMICKQPDRSFTFFLVYDNGYEDMITLMSSHHDSFCQVKKTFQSLTPGEIAVRAQSQTVEKIQHNIADNPAHLKTSEKRIVRWLKDYKRISWNDVRELLEWIIFWKSPWSVMGALVKFVQVYGHSDKRVVRRLTNIIFSPLEDVCFC